MVIHPWVRITGCKWQRGALGREVKYEDFLSVGGGGMGIKNVRMASKDTGPGRQ